MQDPKTRRFTVLAARMLGKEKELLAGKCPFCSTTCDISSFRDDCSRKEYGISGLCQNCQDITFFGSLKIKIRKPGTPEELKEKESLRSRTGVLGRELDILWTVQKYWEAKEAPFKHISSVSPSDPEIKKSTRFNQSGRGGF